MKCDKCGKRKAEIPASLYDDFHFIKKTQLCVSCTVKVMYNAYF